MLACYTADRTKACPIILIDKNDYATWLHQESDVVKSWLTSTDFRPEPNFVKLIPDAKGYLTKVILIVDDIKRLWNVGHLPSLLPCGNYVIEELSDDLFVNAGIAWGLGAYEFTRYKTIKNPKPQLFLPQDILKKIDHTVSAIYYVRDLINTPTDDMGPTQFAQVANELAQQYHASYQEIIGEDLLQQNYACIYTVGRASDDPPRLINFQWGKTTHPKITLVGKGVCFDTGGLDIKPSNAMSLMKKDMGGAAHVLGLAKMIMAADLPVRLRVLIPALENAVSGNAYRPGDIIKSRKGLTIEVGNTDAEGRLVLADALTEAVSEKPDLLIDISTLTGAARVALGTDLPAMFCNSDKLANDIFAEGIMQQDPVWHLPLFKAYREYLNSYIADINNCSNEPYAGAITAALFLKEFIPDEVPWLHFDMMAWNIRQRPGRPIGGEAMALRTLFAYIKKRYGH